MAQKFTKIMLMIMAVSLVLNIFTVNAAASTENFDNRQVIISVAHRGDWHSYPENSAEAVKAAAEYGVVSVDLKVTKDKKAVLMADDTTDRMVVNAKGETVSAAVKDMMFADLTALYLRSENGGHDKAKTDCRVASLEKAIDAIGDGAVLMLSLKCDDFDTVYEAVKAANATDKVVFRFSSDSNKDIIKTTEKVNDITVCGNYQGNIIFLATDAVKKSLQNGMFTVELGSANKNGVLYGDYFMGRFEDNGKAMVSMVNGRCGKRTDNEEGWDDLISRGYTVIETDYPEELKKYLNDIEAEKKQLAYYVDLYKTTDMSPYTTDTENAFVSALSNAEYLGENAGSLSELKNARFDLQNAFDNLTVGEKKAVTLKLEFTVGRFIAVVLCGAVFVISQIYLFKKRDKNKKAQ